MNPRKLLSFCIPSYNSESFLHYALDSLIPGGEEIEVLIIDDGSKDKTLEVAKSYEERYPHIFKAIHQENAGHGGAINHALKLATGIYFKVLDSDDWVDEEALKKLLEFIRVTPEGPDLIVTDYTYWSLHDHPFDTICYKEFFSKHGVAIPFSGVSKFTIQDYCTLHSATFRLDVIKRANITLPEHCSYEDNYFVYGPLCVAKNICYLPFSFYQYQIGRSGQSMEAATLLRKYRDFLTVGKLTFDYLDITKLKKTDKARYRLIKHHLNFAWMAATAFPMAIGTKQGREDKKRFLEECKKSNKRQYKLLNRRFLIRLVNLPGRLGTFFARSGIKVAGNIVDFSGTEEKKKQKKLAKKAAKR
ncbi:MAG: glycosyltransferase family 2 protein [Bacillota bacterium]|nr:glycosyltransferase family 2 protein [Bacillota bacterium]